MTEVIRVLVVDDHPVVRVGLRALIDTEPNMEVVGEAADGVQAVEKVRSTQPDIILLDLVMPRKDGIEAIVDIKQINPDARILVLTSFSEEGKVFPAIKAGALGYVLKDSSPQQLLEAIRDVYRGESSLHPAIARKLVHEFSQPTDHPPTDGQLSQRELQVVKLLAQGQSNREIGDILDVSERTITKHVGNILGKLHLANRTQAALYALREGISTLNAA